MPEFTFEEVKAIAELKFNRGFELLTESIQATVDDLTNELQEAAPPQEANLLAKWRALRLVLDKLKYHPEQFSLEYRQIVNNGEESDVKRMISNPQKILSVSDLAALKEIYDRKRNPNVV